MIGIKAPFSSLSSEITFNSSSLCSSVPVSYTHLDVYKRQIQDSLESGKSTSGDSFGLGNIAQRLKLLYADQYRMQIESIPGRFTAVMIRIPLCEWEEDGV